MWTITNKGGNHLGICTYEVSHNDKVEATFEHNRPDDVAVMFLLAGTAVIKARFKENTLYRGSK